EAHSHAGLVHDQAGCMDVRRLQRLLDAGYYCRIQAHGGLAARHLHRRRFAEEVWQRVEESERDRKRDQRVFPGREAVHCSVLSVPLGSGTCTAERCSTISVSGAISSVTYCSPSLVMRPTRPPAVTTSSPFCSASIIAFCSFARFICGRIMRKYRITNSRMM